MYNFSFSHAFPLDALANIRFFSICSRKCECVCWATVRYLLVNLFEKIISIAHVGSLPSFFSPLLPTMCFVFPSPFDFVRVLLPFMLSQTLQIDESKWLWRPRVSGMEESGTYEKANIKSMFGEKTKKRRREITFKVTCAGWMDEYWSYLWCSIHSNTKHNGLPGHVRTRSYRTLQSGGVCVCLLPIRWIE